MAGAAPPHPLPEARCFLAPFLFFMGFGFVAVVTIAEIVIGFFILVRRTAVGWLTLIGDDTLRIDAERTSLTLKLRADAAQICLVDWDPRLAPFAQFVITDGALTATVCGSIDLTETDDIMYGNLDQLGADAPPE